LFHDGEKLISWIQELMKIRLSGDKTAFYAFYPLTQMQDLVKKNPAPGLARDGKNYEERIVNNLQQKHN
jgi:hypothetical protein